MLRRMQVMLVVLLLVVPAAVVSAEKDDGHQVLARGFNFPIGVMVAPDGSVWVTDSGLPGQVEVKGRDFQTGATDAIARIGNTAQVMRLAPDGTQTVEAELPNTMIGQAVYGAHHLAWLDGVVYVTGCAWTGDLDAEMVANAAGVIKIDDGEVSEVANLFDFEKAHNPDGLRLEVDPYGIAVGRDGNLWVTDAGGNDLLTVNPATGETSLVTVFDGVPSPIPHPNRGPGQTDPVPTAVVFDGQGNLYVSFLPGIPFEAGAAKIVKMAPDGTLSDYATGMTMLSDLRFGPDGNLYAISVGQLGVSEDGNIDAPAVPANGKLLRIWPGGGGFDEVLTGLPTPAGVDFNASGDAYLTVNSIAPPGMGAVWVYKGLVAGQSTKVEAVPAPGLAAADPDRTTGPAAVWWQASLFAGGLALILLVAVAVTKHRRTPPPVPEKGGSPAHR